MEGTLMTTKEERIVERIEGASGGKGILRKEVLIDREQMGEHCGLFGEVTLEPGAVLGSNEHHGETEEKRFRRKKEMCFSVKMVMDMD